MSNLKIIRNEINLDFKSFIFPAGEVGIKLDLKSTSYTAKTGFFAPCNHQTIFARLQKSDDILELMMVVDALRKVDNTPINLFMPWCPYARQDRVCDLGESFSLKVFANLINSFNFNKVTIIDPHSDVTNAVFNNINIITQLQVINKWTDFITRIFNCNNPKFIAPDAGSNKKTAEIAKFFSYTDFVRADKLRDLSNGNIKETIVYANDLNKSDIICADDLVDGGKTFIELAKVLKSKNCGKFILFVTHGIFSKGSEILLENGIDEIYATNSFKDGSWGKCNVFDVTQFIN